MNQFSSIYGQLFCCNCPGGLSGVHCDNKTGVVLTYPLLSTNSYAWLAGLLCFLFLSVFTIIGGIYCCRRRRRQHDNEMVSIIQFGHALLGDEDTPNQAQALVPSSFENPGFLVEKENMKSSQNMTMMVESASEDSIVSLFHCEHDCLEPEETETRLLPEDYDAEVSS